LLDCADEGSFAAVHESGYDPFETYALAGNIY
jgi:hypothetical protein